MASILNDVILKNLTCSRCEKYLSVLPIKVYPNGIIKCGRCCTKGDDGTMSMYNTVAKNCLFKCVNRYERCNKLLAASEVAEHEKICVSETYHCPKCEYTFSGSAFQLVLHYTKEHPKSIIKNGSFSVKVKRDFIEKYMYLIKDYLFFVLVENVAKDNVLYMSTVSLITYKNVKQWFLIKPTHRQAKSFTTCKKPCHDMERFECDFISVRTHSMNEVTCRIYLDLSEDANTVNQITLIPQPENSDENNETHSNKNISVSASTQTLCVKDVLGVKLTDEFKKECPGYDLTPCGTALKENISVSASTQTLCVKDVLGVKLTDEFKKEYPGYDLTPCGTALFKDSDRVELTCSNCRQLTGCNVFDCHLGKHIACWDCKAWCGICNTTMNGWNVRAANINELLLLPCRWQCGQHFSGNYLTQHELSCGKSNFACLMCTSGHMSLEQISNHLVTAHSNYKNATQFSLSGYLKECEGQIKGSVRFFQNGCWFAMCWKKKEGVYKATVISYNIELYELAIITDSSKKYNKIDGTVEFVLSDNPKFYLKRIRN